MVGTVADEVDVPLAILAQREDGGNGIAVVGALTNFSIGESGVNGSFYILFQVAAAAEDGQADVVQVSGGGIAQGLGLRSELRKGYVELHQDFPGGLGFFLAHPLLQFVPGTSQDQADGQEYVE